MGCTQSKIENEETVNRCKERKQYMERAVTARNKFAAAHSAHVMSLKNTGAALSDFAQGEAIYPSSTAAAAAASPSAAIGSAAPPPPPPLPHSYENFAPPPPPPLDSFQNNSPLQRAATMPEFVIPRPGNNHIHEDPITEEENEEDDELESSHSLKRRSKSSKSAGGGGISPPEDVQDKVLHQQQQQQQRPPPPPSNSMSWDYFFGTDSIPGPTLADVEENSVEREEMERNMLAERARRKEMEEMAKAAKAEPVEKVSDLPPQPPPPEAAMAAAMAGKRAKQVVLPAEGKKKSAANVSLVQIFVDLDDCFLKASESAHDVSRMLEATRLHYHSNFADKRGIKGHCSWKLMFLVQEKSCFDDCGRFVLAARAYSDDSFLTLVVVFWLYNMNPKLFKQVLSICFFIGREY